MEMIMKNKVITKSLARNKWLPALRSGKYKQGKGRLQYGNQHGSFYCCLGVAKEVCGVPANDALRLENGVLGIYHDRNENVLMDMNDNSGKTFKQIAAYIEKHIIPHLPDKQPDK